MRLLEAAGGRLQVPDGMLARLRILIGADGFGCRDFGEGGDAVGLFAVGFGKLRHFRFQGGEQFQQFLLALGAHGFRAADLGFDFADGFFDHDSGQTLPAAPDSARLSGLPLAGFNC